MNEWRGEELSEHEKEALSALPRERAPRPEIEDGLVAELRKRGRLRTRRARSWWKTVAAAAASVLLFASGAVWRDQRKPSAHEQPHWVLLLREGHEDRTVPAEESRRRVNEYANWARTNAARGLIDGEELGEERVLFSGTKGRTAARTPESVAGYFLLGEVDAERARAIALSCPHLAYGGEVELRWIQKSIDSREAGKQMRQLGYTDPPYVDVEDDR